MSETLFSEIKIGQNSFYNPHVPHKEAKSTDTKTYNQHLPNQAI